MENNEPNSLKRDSGESSYSGIRDSGSQIPSDGEKNDDARFEVVFDGNGDDKEDMRNLSKLHKWIIAIIISVTSFCVTCTSAAWSMASDNIMEHFGISHEVSTLGISLYVFGLGLGGIFLSPISEFHGRKITYIISLSFSFAFQCLTAFSPNIGSMLFGRYMSGFFGSAFMSVAAGSLADIFAKDEMSTPLLLYTISPFVGPGVLPLISGFINSSVYFRWTFYVMLIWTGVLVVMIVLFVPETYKPVLLKKKAARLRKTTGDNRFYAPLERDPTSLFESTVMSCKKPILLIFKDYMTLALCFYTGFALAIVYLFFIALPYIYKTVFEFKLASQGLAFLGLIIGMALASLASPSLFNKQYLRLIEKNGGVHKPEFKFLPLMAGVFFIPVGLFIMAWTSYPHLHWIGPIIGSSIFGAGTVLIFNGVFAYTVDAYRLYAASAMATNTFIRCTMSGVFPLFGLQMYEGMGIQWATTFLALIACAMIPVPFILYKYGPYLRSKSSFTWS